MSHAGLVMSRPSLALGQGWFPGTIWKLSMLTLSTAHNTLQRIVGAGEMSPRLGTLAVLAFAEY